MIKISEFIDFIRNTFGTSVVHFEEFKADLFFIEVDCLIGVEKKLSIEISDEFVKVSSVSKEPSIDFSLHDYVFTTNDEAKIFLNKIHETGVYPK